MKLIFDRSSLHGANLEKLLSGNFMSLLRKRHIRVFHTPRLIEETFATYSNVSQRDALRKEFPIIMSLCNGRWFRQLKHIYHSEIDRKIECHYLSQNRRRFLEKGILDAVITESFRGYEKALKDLDIAEADKLESRKAYVELRQSSKPNPKPTFGEFHAIHYQFFLQKVAEVNPEIDGQKLSYNNFEICYNSRQAPYLYAWLSSILYEVYYAQYEQSTIDKNARADIEQLCYLNDVDGIVTEDTKFMKSAFQDGAVPAN